MKLQDFAGRTLILKFGATWCPPCHALAPVLDSLSEEYGTDLVQIDIDDETELPAELGVRSIPATFAIKDGNILASIVGNAPKDKMRTLFQSLGDNT